MQLQVFAGRGSSILPHAYRSSFFSASCRQALPAPEPASPQTPPLFILRIEPSSTRYLLSQTVPSSSARLSSSQFRGEPMQFKLVIQPLKPIRPSKKGEGTQRQHIVTRLTSNIHPTSNAHLRFAMPPPRQNRTDQARMAHRAVAVC